MSEIELTDEQANALHGTIDADTGFRYHSPGDASYFTEGQRQRHRLLTLAKTISNNLRVYRDGEMTFGVRPGRAADGDTVAAYAGCSAVELTDDATNYVYLTAADLAAGDSVTVSTEGFPAQSQTPHVPLAAVAAAGGAYGPDDIVDCRAAAAMSLGSGLTAAQANTLTGGSASNADALHVHDSAGLASGVRALTPLASVTGVNNGDGLGMFTIQIVDALGNPIADKYFISLWTSNGDKGEPYPYALGFDGVGGYGTVIREITPEVEYEMITSSSGMVKRAIAVASDGTYWVTVKIGGLLCSGSVMVTGA